jgi:hypothetical protein
VQEKLIKFATRITAFMYLTDFRENNLLLAWPTRSGRAAVVRSWRRLDPLYDAALDEVFAKVELPGDGLTFGAKPLGLGLDRLSANLGRLGAAGQDDDQDDP